MKSASDQQCCSYFGQITPQRGIEPLPSYISHNSRTKLFQNEIPPSNLKRQLVRNRMYDRFCITPNCVICPTGKPGDCMCSGVIYLITCISCGEEYIGETA
ncbi:hypothetical protein Y032_0199g1647 [Ancylostoma ceylanicum]|uniref:Uncharacterized protein n=1 Tax=Ancylostoma ceylanicum TaxID=53326 RepID=A0A016SNT3_9BILA|nr:hypothetical protein Y032_0199g1647 [Ancylostoma ceylanicum]